MWVPWNTALGEMLHIVKQKHQNISDLEAPDTPFWVPTDKIAWELFYKYWKIFVLELRRNVKWGLQYRYFQIFQYSEVLKLVCICALEWTCTSALEWIDTLFSDELLEHLYISWRGLNCIACWKYACTLVEVHLYRLVLEYQCTAEHCHTCGLEQICTCSQNTLSL